MNGYGFYLFTQTLLALIALGLAGNWVIRPFRREDRPYLWLASPLAGLFTLGGALVVLYYGAGLSFSWCLPLAWGVNVATTAACLSRGRCCSPGFPVVLLRSVSYPKARRDLGYGITEAGRPGSRPANRLSRWPSRDVFPALAVALAASAWASGISNRTAIENREPTIASMDGSDMYGYAISAEWLLQHTAEQLPRGDNPLELTSYLHFTMDGGRPVSFFLVAAAADMRGTTSLFSYDWASGVTLAAALMAYAGLFASNTLLLIMLALGAGVSNWLAMSRTGYMAKCIAYPGFILLIALVLTAIRQSGGTRLGNAARPYPPDSRNTLVKRLIVLALVGPAVGYSLAPIASAAIVGMVVGSYVIAVLLVYAIDRWRGGGGEMRTTVLRPARIAILASFIAVGPAFLVHYPAHTKWSISATRPHSGLKMPVIVPVALDLEPPGLPLVRPQTAKRLLVVCCVLLLVLPFAALWRRQPDALALAGVGAVIPIAWLSGAVSLYFFQGLIYPLTLAGAAILAGLPAATSYGSVRVRALLALLLVAMIVVRIPQSLKSSSRYVFEAEPYRVVIRQSELEGLRQAIGAGDAVDLDLGYYADNHPVLSELIFHGVSVQFRSTTWERMLKNKAAHTNCPVPNLDLPKARYTLRPRNAYAPPGTERYLGSRLKLCEDRDVVVDLGVHDFQDLLWDQSWRPGVWIGNTPTTFLFHNGTGRPQDVLFLADTLAGPANPKPARTLITQLGDRVTRLELPGENRAVLPLHLAPGFNQVALAIEEPADPPADPKQAVLLLLFRNWRLEPVTEHAH